MKYLFALAFVCAWTVSARSMAEKAEVEGLVRQLGADRYEDRERASRALERLGAPALEQLRLARNHPDPEVRNRAASLVGRIEGALADRELCRVRALIAQLSSDSFPARQEASRQLSLLGKERLPLLEEAKRDAQDAEVRLRLQRATDAIKKRG